MCGKGPDISTPEPNISLVSCVLFISLGGFHSADALVSKTVGEQLARNKTLAMKGTSSQDT